MIFQYLSYTNSMSLYDLWFIDDSEFGLVYTLSLIFKRRKNLGVNAKIAALIEISNNS